MKNERSWKSRNYKYRNTAREYPSIFNHVIIVNTQNIIVNEKHFVQGEETPGIFSRPQ